MLFGYPLEATKGNWLHVCICQMLRRIHAAVAQGQAAPSWPDVIPQPHRNRLRRRTGIRDRLATYANAFGNLAPAEQLAVRRAFCRQNRIRGLLAGSCNCDVADQLPTSVRNALDNVSHEAFRLLSVFKIRDKQYRVIYDDLGHKVCPFCGIEYFDAPQAPRGDFDHYLPRSRYPFASSNPKNLVPMGGRCNSAYKGTADVLWNGAHRRTACYPYDHPGIAVTLANSQPFGGAKDGAHPDWDISFMPPSPESQTWDDVFKIGERYTRDILQPHYEQWLDEFAKYCASAGIAKSHFAELINALKRYREFCSSQSFSDRGFLKAEVFTVLIHHCEGGNQRLINLLMDLP